MVRSLLVLVWRITLLSFLFLGLQVLLRTGLATAGEAKPAWQVEWEKTVRAANTEGRVILWEEWRSPIPTLLQHSIKNTLLF